MGVSSYSGPAVVGVKSRPFSPSPHMQKTARRGISLAAMPPAVSAPRAQTLIASSQGSAIVTPAPRRNVRRRNGECE